MKTQEKVEDEQREIIREESNIFCSPCSYFFSQVVKAFLKCLGHDRDDAAQHNYSPAPTTQTTVPAPPNDPSKTEMKTPKEYITTTTSSLTVLARGRGPSRNSGGLTRGRGGQTN